MEKARKEAQEARAALDALKAKEDLDKKTLSQEAHQFVVGIPEALKDEPRTAGDIHATSLANRADDRLTAVLGKLPPEMRAEIIQIVLDIKSNDAKRIADAESKLAAKDTEARMLKQNLDDTIIRERDAVKNLKEKDTAFSSTLSKNAELTTKVAEYAKKSYDKERENGSLAATAERYGMAILGIIILYVIAHVVVPSLAQEFPAVRPLQVAYKAIKSVTSCH